VNRGSEPAELSAVAPSHWDVRAVTDVWNDERLSVVEGTIKAAVKPKGARIITWQE
jgi:hypothetical protein